MQSSKLDFEFVACACPPGKEGTPSCNYGRRCGTLKANGADVGLIFEIRENLAVPLFADKHDARLLPNRGASKNTIGTAERRVDDAKVTIILINPVLSLPALTLPFVREHDCSLNFFSNSSLAVSTLEKELLCPSNLKYCQKLPNPESLLSYISKSFHR